MKEQVNKLRLVVSTLEGLDIKATKNNMDRLLGCIQAIEQVICALESEEAVSPAVKEVDTDAT